MKCKLYYLLFLFSCSLVSSQNLPFHDSFNESTLGNWEVTDDEPQYSGPSNWFIEDGVLRQNSNIWAYVAPDEFKYHLGTHISAGYEKWDNYSFNVLAKATDNDGIGIIFRYVDKNNYYRFLLLQDNGNGGPLRRLQKFVNGEPETIYEESPSQAIPEGWFSLTADVRADSITVYVNGEHFTTQRDTQFVEGKVGLSCYAMTGAYFDSVSVTNEKNVYEQPEQKLVEINRMPYLQLPDTNSIAIAWRTIEASMGKVKYGETVVLENEILEDSSGNIHFVKIENLEANRKYYYRVFNDEVSYSRVDSFYTVKPDNVKDVTFLVWGDSGTGNDAQYKIASLLEKETADFGIHVGDVSQSDGSEYDEIYFKPYENIVNGINIYTCIGNHDVYYDDAKTYLETFYYPSNNDENTERYYSFTWGNTFFINLDSNIDFSPNSPQYKFLKDQLESDEKRNAGWTFVYFHHPPYCELWDSWDGDDNVRNYLLPLFEENDVDIVFNGHTHGYERGKLNGVYYVITGGGGGGLDDYARDFSHITKSFSKYHYTKVEINDNKLKLTAIDENEEVIDSFEFVKSITGIDEKEDDAIQGELILEQNYPNPFNPSTTIKFNIPTVVGDANFASPTSLKIYDILGNEIRTLINGPKSPGTYEIKFDGSNLSSGIYYYQLSTNNKTITKKMLLLR
ncbi:MAG: metallophosphoesterase [Ignavibacteria bacterium]|jgi:predicted phosphodiesterase